MRGGAGWGTRQWGSTRPWVTAERSGNVQRALAPFDGVAGGQRGREVAGRGGTEGVRERWKRPGRAGGLCPGLARVAPSGGEGTAGPAPQSAPPELKYLTDCAY